MTEEEKLRLEDLEFKIQTIRADLEALRADVDVAESFSQSAISRMDALENRLNITISDL